MSIKSLHSVGGFSVTDNSGNIVTIIDSSGNISTTGLSVSGISNLGNSGNVKITGGTAGYYLQTDGTGNLTWAASGGGANGTPGGANTYVQYNNAGSFGGSSSFTFDATSNTLSVATVSISGNANIGNIGTAGLITATGNIRAGNLTTPGALSATGNATASYFIGNGSLLTGISANTFSTITVPGQSNIVANSSSSTLNIVTTGGLISTTDATTSTLTLNQTKPISSGSSAPSSPSANDLWWDSDTGTLYIYYYDGVSYQWVQTQPQILTEGPAGTFTLTGKLIVTSDVTIQGMLYETSDEKLKKNIKQIATPVNTVKQLRGVTFNWVKNDKPTMGLIAQEVEKILPYLVQEDATGTKTINYSAIIGLLIESIKELEQRVGELENIKPAKKSFFKRWFGK